MTMMVPVFTSSSTSRTTVLLFLFLTVFSRTCSASMIDVDTTDGGYRHVVVAISSQVPQTQAVDLVNSIKETLRRTSSYLYEASEGQTWLKEVTVMLPRTWRELPQALAVTQSIGLNTYDAADLRVTQANGLYGHVPYTHQTQGCGKPGQYIQLTPQFFLDFNETSGTLGDPGRVLVHEWSHLRYGVFDENGFHGDPMYPPFYFGEDHEVLRTGCSNRKVVGDKINMNTNGYCEENPRTGLPEKNCAFKANMKDNDQVLSSIMDVYYLPKVTSFCGGTHQHNSLAPNKHNNLCNGRSVSDVIQSSEDFAKLPKTGQTLDPTTTTFQLVQEESPRYVLVVDTSNKRSDYLRDMTFYIATSKALKYYFPIGSSVGIVEYSSEEKTQVKVEVTKLTEDRDRDKISESVPDLATSAQQRCVLCGITEAIKALKSEASGSNIILLTDGNMRRSELEDVRKVIKQAKVRLFVLLYPNPGLRGVDWEGVVKDTNGKAYVIDEPRKNKDGSAVTTMELEAAYLSILRETLHQEMAPITVIQHVKELSKQIARSNIYQYMARNDQGSLVRGSFSLDAPSNLIFSVYYYERGYIAEDKTRLIGPTKSYDSNDLKKEKYISTVFFLIDNAQNGTWNYEVVGKPPTQQPLIVTAAATPSPGSLSQPISIKGWMNVEDEVNPAKKPVIIYVDLKKDDQPVIGAQVTVYVEIVSGNREQFVQPAPILLRDNGNGDADITANDGVYSAYFTQFYNVSRYNVRVIAKDGGQAYVVTGQRHLVSGNDDLIPGEKVCCGSGVPLEKLEPTGPFSREYTIGSFNVVSKLEGDSFPPGRIGDLQIVENRTNIPSPRGTLITLRWTAPGDDYDFRRASEYELRYSKNRKDLLERFENAGTRIEKDVDGQKLVPLEAGSVQTVMVAMPDVDRDVIYYVAVRASDEVKSHRAKLSNVVQVLVKRTPRKPPPPPGQTDPPSPTSVIKTGKKRSQDAHANEFMTADWTIIVASIIAFLIFVMIIFIVIYVLFRRRKEPRHGPNQVMISPRAIPPQDKAHIVAQLGDYSMSPVQSWPASTLLNHYDKVEQAKMRNQPPPIMTYDEEDEAKNGADSNGSQRSSVSSGKDEKIRLESSPDLTSSTPSLTPSANLSLRRVTQV